VFATIRDLFQARRRSNVVAKSRLQLVLVQDRAGLTNEELAQFRREMMEVIQRYFVIDESGFDVNYQRSDDATTLLINSPIIVRRDSEKRDSEKDSEKVAQVSKKS
jgi:cell division topological specificity factor